MIYKIYCLEDENGKVMYIGYTSLTEAKRMAEHRHSHPNRRSYRFHVIDVFDNKKEALAAERKYIKMYNPEENIAPGQGYPESLVEGRKKSNANRSLPVLCIDTGVVYPNISEAARQTGSNRNHVKDCCHNRRHQTNNLHFRFADCIQEKLREFERSSYANTEVNTETKESVSP